MRVGAARSASISASASVCEGVRGVAETRRCFCAQGTVTGEWASRPRTLALSFPGQGDLVGEKLVIGEARVVFRGGMGGWRMER